MGVHTDRVIAITFGLGSALAGAGGILFGLDQPKIDPLSGVQPGLKAFVAAVLGGIGNIPGAMLGGLLIGMVEQLASAYLDDEAGFRAEHGPVEALHVPHQHVGQWKKSAAEPDGEFLDRFEFYPCGGKRPLESARDGSTRQRVQGVRRVHLDDPAANQLDPSIAESAHFAEAFVLVVGKARGWRGGDRRHQVSLARALPTRQAASPI
jgi:hypothetical protein